MVNRLEKYRRRLMLEKAVEGRPVVATVKVRKDKPLSETIDIEEVQRQLDAAIATVTPQKIADVAETFVKRGMAAQAAVDKLTKEEDGIPKWLDRSDPLLNEKMTKARKLAEAEERKKMPLSDKAALQYIKKEDRKRKAR
jgi:hypothetical protein